MSERLQGLFEAARQDGPSPEARVAMWVGIETASLTASAGGAGAAIAGGAGTGAVAVKAGLVTSKLVIGLFVGASLVAGIAGAVLVGVLDARAHAVVVEPVRAAPRTLERAVPSASTPPQVILSGHVATAAPQDVGQVIELPATPLRTGTTTLSEHDRLAREARMVNEARGALHRGEPDVALRIVRAARTQPGARLVPEELTVEAQALRSTGDEAGAERVEAELARRFPGGELPAH